MKVRQLTGHRPAPMKNLIHVTHFMRRPMPNIYSIERLFEDIRLHLRSDSKVTVHTCRNFSTGIWGRLKDVWLARSGQGDVNHVTGDIHYLTYLLDRRRTILTIHDLNTLSRYAGVRRWVLWLLWYWLPVRLSAIVTVISESTRAELLNHVKCDPAKIRVIPNIVSSEFRPSEKAFATACPKILQMGTAWNKNLERLAEALDGITCKLVIVGSLSEQQTSVLDHHAIDRENHVGLSRGALVQQYEACDLMVFASTYEGFGLPIVEAQAVGRPVVTSNVASMPEVAGGGACLVNPNDPDSIRRGIRRVIDDPDYRSRLVRVGFANVARFRADRIAEQYASLYREIAGRRATGLKPELERRRCAG